MKSFSIAVTLTVAAILVVLSAPTSAQGIDWKKGKLGRVVRVIGTYNNVAVLDDPHVVQAMTLALGKDVGLLKENLATGSQSISSMAILCSLAWRRTWAASRRPLYGSRFTTAQCAP